MMHRRGLRRLQPNLTVYFRNVSEMDVLLDGRQNGMPANIRQIYIPLDSDSDDQVMTLLEIILITYLIMIRNDVSNSLIIRERSSMQYIIT